MIEKLPNFDSTEASIYHVEKLYAKVNQLVDAVNSIVSVQEKLIDSRFVVETKHEEPDGDDAIQEVIHTDPYAEQRRWIGKLCRFWNKTEYTDDLYGLLTDIVPTNKYKPEDNYFVPFKDEFGSFYEHCEPVKPDDDIIYKGE